MERNEKEGIVEYKSTHVRIKDEGKTETANRGIMREEKVVNGMREKKRRTK